MNEQQIAQYIAWLEDRIAEAKTFYAEEQENSQTQSFWLGQRRAFELALAKIRTA